MKRLKKVTVISPKTKAEVIKNCDSVKADLIVIPNPIMPEFKLSTRSFFQQEPRILFVGTNGNKNFDRAIESIKGLSCILVVLGKLSVRQVDLLKKFDIKYECHHSLTDIEVANLYSDSDLLLFPSLYEGFGLPIIEAFKTGKPVVTSNMSPMIDVASGAAQLVNPFSVESIREGVLRVLSDREYREYLVGRGLVVANEFNGEEISKRYLAVYRQLFSGESN